MKSGWTYTELDRQIAEELQNFLPSKIFDMHTHIYLVADFNVNAPKEGDVWGLNVCRERKPNRNFKKDVEDSSWIQTYGSFVPPKFGKLIF